MNVHNDTRNMACPDVFLPQDQHKAERMSKWSKTVYLSTLFIAACGGGGGGGSTSSPAGNAAPMSINANAAEVSAPPKVATNASLAVTSGATPIRSIRDWVTCGGTVDGAAGVAKAFAAAKNGAFVLNVDCPVLIKIGSDVNKTIFIDNGTTVQFSGSGLFIVDNVFLPAFVIANSSNIKLADWQIEYAATVPVNPYTGGYYKSGQWTSDSSATPAAFAFNNYALKNWLANNKAVKFVNYNDVPNWTGPVDAAAIFHFRGSASNIQVSGMKMFVPANAGGNQYIPTAFSFNVGPVNGAVVSSSIPISSASYAIPSNITFSNIDIDGCYMGWQGAAKNVTFSTIRSHRYGDLQDASGGTVGGVNKWFAPPHLFYINYDPANGYDLQSGNITITDVIDYGIRTGVARDKGGSDTISGYANSLKIGGHDIVVSNYESDRPDGLLDVLPSSNASFSGLKGVYNSAFLNGVYPAVRFPATGYTNVKFQGLNLTDLATSTSVVPISGTFDPTNQTIYISGANITLNGWADTVSALTSSGQRFKGTDINVGLNYKVTLQGSTSQMSISSGVLNASGWSMTSPAAIALGQQAQVVWGATNASGCSLNGALTASGLNGSKSFTPTTQGTQQVNLLCTTFDGLSSNGGISVNVQ